MWFCGMILIFSDPPDVQLRNNVTIFEENEKLLLHCDTDGGNPVNITSIVWEYPGDQPHFLDKPNKNQTLKIQALKVTDTGLYWCTAQNDAGAGTGEIQIIVQCEFSAIFIYISNCNLTFIVLISAIYII